MGLTAWWISTAGMLCYSEDNQMHERGEWRAQVVQTIGDLEGFVPIDNVKLSKYDPNHLYLGSRIHGRCLHEGTFRGATPVDIVSVNYYHRWSAEHDRISNWAKWSGRPLLVSEWYAQSLASADTDASGAGFRVRSNRDRGLFYQNLTLGLLRHPGCVGWHWFKYGGDGCDFRKGVVDRQYNPHTDMLKLMGELNRQIYPLTNPE